MKIAILIEKRCKFQVHLVEEDEQTLEMLVHTHSYQPNLSPDEILVRQELKQLVHRAIGELPPTMRAVMIMWELDEMSFKEIAEVLGQPEGTVKSTVFRARKKLQQILSRLLET